VAPVRLAFTYHLALPATPDVTPSTIRAAIGPKLGSHHTGLGEFPFHVSASVYGVGRLVKVDLRFASGGDAEAETTWDASRALTALADDMRRSASSHTSAWQSWSNKDPVLAELRHQLNECKPSASIEVPLLEADRDVLVDDVAATRVHDAAIRDKCPFLSDQERRTANVEVMLAEGSLRIDGDDAALVVANGKAYLETSRPFRRARPELKRRLPLWALTSALIAAISVAMSFLTLSWLSLGAFAIVVVITTFAAVYFAPRFKAKQATTALGLVPIAILAAFAVGYGCVALATPTAITLAGTPVSYLRDPLLLSLSLLTTVGVLDLALHGAVRSVAYLEMLLVASAAGGAAIVAVRAFSQRAQELLDALSVEQRR
jgi:hypothetical protein